VKWEFERTIVSISKYDSRGNVTILQHYPHNLILIREVCSLNAPWFFAASHQPPCILYIGAFGKSSQHYIIKIVMASIMYMPFMLVFHQSECISAIKRILFYYFRVHIFESIYVFVSSLSLRCMLIPCALRVGVKTLHTINQTEFMSWSMFVRWRPSSILR